MRGGAQNFSDGSLEFETANKPGLNPGEAKPDEGGFSAHITRRGGPQPKAQPRARGNDTPVALPRLSAKAHVKILQSQSQPWALAGKPGSS